VFRNLRDEAVGEAVVSVLRKSPAALTSLGEDRLKRLLAGYPDKVRRDSEPLFQQLQDAQRARIEKLRRLEPVLTAGRRCRARPPHLLRPEGGVLELPYDRRRRRAM